MIEETGERHLSDTFNADSLHHLHRYAVAQLFCEDKFVVDVACGEGFGSHLLAQVAAKVVGVDISEDVVAYTRAKYGRANLSFKVGNVLDLPLEDASVDVFVSMETIEHHDKHEQMLCEIKRVLRKDGLLIISTPDRLNYSDRPRFANPFHVKELYLEEFRALISSYFKNSAMLFQKVTYGSVVVPEKSGCGFTEFSGDFNAILATGQLQNPLINICLASDAELPSVTPSLFDGMRVMDDAIAQTQQLFINSRSLRLGRMITWPFRKLTNR